MEREYAEELEEWEGGNMRRSQMRAVEQEREMNQTLMSLESELGKLREEEKESLGKLEKKRFFKEWSVMSKELEGARSLKGRLEAELEKKLGEIK